MKIQIQNLLHVFNDKTGSIEHMGNTGIQGLTYNFIPGTVLWHAEFVNAETKTTAVFTNLLPGKYSLKQDTPDSVTLKWRKVFEESKTLSIDVTVRLEYDNDAGNVLWKIKLARPDDGMWKLNKLHFPVITVSAGKDSKTILCDGWGRVIKNACDRYKTLSPYYPGHYVMQFIGQTDHSDALQGNEKSVYLAACDGNAGIKQFNLETDKVKHTIKYSITNFPKDFVNQPKTVNLEYAFILKPLSGGWYTAGKEYRSWAVKQLWCSKGRIDERKDYSPVMLDTVIWSNAGLNSPRPTRTQAADVVKKAQYLGIPLACHYYYWHQIPFDHTYPHYFPAKAEFAGEVKTLKDNNIPVMPYINGRLYDSENPEFETTGKPLAVKDSTGEVSIELYASKRKLCVMCPTAPGWRKIVLNLVKKLIKDYSIDGIYIDQIAIAPPKLCYDASHAHPVGGRDAWVRSYRKLLEQVKTYGQKENPQFFITSEGNAEPYIDFIDNQLMVNCCGDDMAPLFSAVYSGYTSTFGMYYIAEHELKGDHQSFRARVAECFTFGAQLAWDLPSELFFPSPTPAGEYLKTLAQARRALSKYIVSGEYAMPVRIEDTVLQVEVTRKIWANTLTHKMAVIQSSAWYNKNDDTVCVILTNCAVNEPVSVKFNINPAEYSLQQSNGYALYKYDYQNNTESLWYSCLAGKSIDAEVVIQPGKVVTYLLKKVL
ncbi:MAG: DUF6259 domain-containing protein [Elusimicrobiota bacterium]